MTDLSTLRIFVCTTPKVVVKIEITNGDNRQGLSLGPITQPGPQEMTLAHLIAYAWLATVVVTIVLAARRGVPIVNAFGSIDSRPGIYCSLAVLAVVGLLAILQLKTGTLMLRQQPMSWAMLLVLFYAWACIGFVLRKEN